MRASTYIFQLKPSATGVCPYTTRFRKTIKQNSKARFLDLPSAGADPCRAWDRHQHHPHCTACRVRTVRNRESRPGRNKRDGACLKEIYAMMTTQFCTQAHVQEGVLLSCSVWLLIWLYFDMYFGDDKIVARGTRLY